MIEWVRGHRLLAAGAACLWYAVLPVVLCIALALPFAEASIAKPRFAAIAVDARTGKVLFSRDPDGLTHPASLTKVMTLYILFGELKTGKVTLDTQFKVSKAAAAKAPSKLGLKPGQTISVENAIKALVTRSANDVAAVIAENLSASETEFAARMTRMARELGMSRSVFRNASGLPDPGQITTARDMAVLGLRVQHDFPEYYPYFRITSFTYGGRVIRTHNHLLGRYAGVDGIKTGYVAASGFNLTSSARRGEKRVIGVVMGASSASSRNVYMMAMLDKAFPKCKDGSTIADAIEGTMPKLTKPDIKLAETPGEPAKKFAAGPANKPESEPSRKVAVKPKKLPEPTAEAAEEVPPEQADGDEIIDAKPAEPVMAEAAEPQNAPVTASVALTETVLSKTTPDGTPLPFAVKTPGDDAGGVIVIDAADPSWHIQIGAYPSKTDAQAVLYKVRDLDLDLLDNKEPLTVEVQKGSDTIYRARFSGFTETTARAACRRLTKQGFGCVAMQPQS
jgi:D-alanyl-D-alanine carboxypeptidase